MKEFNIKKITADLNSNKLEFNDKTYNTFTEGLKICGVPYYNHFINYAIKRMVVMQGYGAVPKYRFKDEPIHFSFIESFLEECRTKFTKLKDNRKNPNATPQKKS